MQQPIHTRTHTIARTRLYVNVHTKDYRLIIAQRVIVWHCVVALTPPSPLSLSPSTGQRVVDIRQRTTHIVTFGRHTSAVHTSGWNGGGALGSGRSFVPHTDDKMFINAVRWCGKNDANWCVQHYLYINVLHRRRVFGIHSLVYSAAHKPPAECNAVYALCEAFRGCSHHQTDESFTRLSYA